MEAKKEYAVQMHDITIKFAPTPLWTMCNWM